MAQEIQDVEIPTEEVPMVIKPSREPLFGALLFGGAVLIGIALLALLGWGGYRGWHATKNQAALPSIAALPQDDGGAPAPETTPTEAVPTIPESVVLSPEELLTKAKGTDIQVLNGGGVRGSAGVAAEILKKDGYTKLTIGNTVKDYTGTVVYFSDGLDGEADTVKKTLFKIYPKTETKPALKENAETTKGAITVIIGK
ncbi:MAG: LytR C-terminal domain-containing protein [Candidatus Moranbacteria bacterium]|nr:LytR C-terminal domain-containing protein [Candidatus Moranbacteria bacterium]